MTSVYFWLVAYMFLYMFLISNSRIYRVIVQQMRPQNQPQKPKKPIQTVAWYKSSF